MTLKFLYTMYFFFWKICRPCAITKLSFSHLIIKSITPPSGPEHYHHKTKLQSYQNEKTFYENYAHFYAEYCKIPTFHFSYLNDNDIDQDENAKNQLDEIKLVLEDLVAYGTPNNLPNKTWLEWDQVKKIISWLAGFHAKGLILISEGNYNSSDLWQRGTYWNLPSRQHNHKNMPESDLKEFATDIDIKLVNSKFFTIIHGDSKLPNFMVNDEFTKISGFDFQWTGRGCGLQDVYYLLTSCYKLEIGEETERVLPFYFEELEKYLNGKFDRQKFDDLVTDWSGLWSFIVADFERMIRSWLPQEKMPAYKLTNYSDFHVKKVIQLLK